MKPYRQRNPSHGRWWIEPCTPVRAQQDVRTMASLLGTKWSSSWQLCKLTSKCPWTALQLEWNRSGPQTCHLLPMPGAEMSAESSPLFIVPRSKLQDFLWHSQALAPTFVWKMCCLSTLYNETPSPIVLWHHHLVFWYHFFQPNSRMLDPFQNLWLVISSRIITMKGHHVGNSDILMHLPHLLWII